MIYKVTGAIVHCPKIGRKGTGKMTRALVRPIGVCITTLNLVARKKKLMVCPIAVLLLTVFLCHSVLVCRASPPGSAKLSPFPPVYVADFVGEVFGIALEISDVVGLHSASFIIEYDSSLLDVHTASQGSFFSSDAWFECEIDDSSGMICLDTSLRGRLETVSGSGVLAELFFEVVQASFENGGRPITFLAHHLYGLNHEELDCKCVGAVLFWQSATPTRTGCRTAPRWRERSWRVHAGAESCVP